MNSISVVFRNAGKYRYLILVFLFGVFVLDILSKSMVLPLLSAFTGTAAPAKPIVSQVLGVLRSAGVPTSTTSLLFLFAILTMFKAVFAILERIASARASLGYQVRLRLKLYEALFAARHGGPTEEISRLTNALTTQSAQSAGTIYLLFQMVQVGCVFLASFLLAAFISVKVVAAAMVIGGGIAAVFWLTMRAAHAMGTRLARLDKEYFGSVLQFLNNYRYVKTAALDGHFRREFSPVLEGIRSTQVAFAVLNAATKIFSQPLGFLTAAVLVWIGPYIGEARETVIAQGYILLTMMVQASSLAAVLQNFRRQYAAVEYCDGLDADLRAAEEIPGAKPYAGLGSGIEFEGVGYAHPRRGTVAEKRNATVGGQDSGDAVFRGVSFALPAGSLTVLEGDSGGGKTTLLNLLSGLLLPDRGSVRVDGTDLRELNLADYRRRVGLVTQDTVVFNLSVRENLALRNENADPERMRDLIRRFRLESLFPGGEIDLDYPIGENAANLSGGQRQRLALIRELLLDPDLLLLDEATSALDDEAKNAVIDYLAENKGRWTVVVVSHQKDFRRIADAVLHVGGGSVRAAA